MKVKANSRIVFLVIFFNLILYRGIYIDIGLAIKMYTVVALFIGFYLFMSQFNNTVKLKSYEKYFLLFIIYSIMRGLLSKNPVESLKHIIILLLCVLLYICIVHIGKKYTLNQVMKTIIYSNIIFCIIGLALYYLDNDTVLLLDRGRIRFRGLVGDPNFLGLYLIMPFFISVYYIKQYSRIALISIVLTIWSLALCMSRGAYVSIIIGCIVLILSHVINKKILISIVVFLILAILLVFAFKNLNFNFDLRIIDTIILRFKSQDISSGRIKIWMQGLEICKLNPLFGIGINNFLSYNLSLFNDYHYTHNTILEVLVENGLIGFSLFSMSIYKIFIIKSERPEIKLMKIVILSTLICSMFLSVLTDAVLFFTFAIYTLVRNKI